MTSKYDLNVFANNLKKYMDLHGKSRKDVCEALGISYYTFSDWCNAKKFPRINSLEALANYFGIEKSDLLENKEKKSTNTSELSESKKKIMDLLMAVPEEKIDYVLRVLSTLLEVEE